MSESRSSAYFITISVPRTAMLRHSSGVTLKTTRWNSGAVAL